jgi:hypothetical protein
MPVIAPCKADDRRFTGLTATSRRFCKRKPQSRAEAEAIGFLNQLGNIYFAKIESPCSNTRRGYSLCGTKLLTRHHYRPMNARHRDMGDFDPFGDFGWQLLKMTLVDSRASM